ncbi:MAG: hypothetical protein WCW67_08040 [Candidatus Margulisiibacteriota bacterium]|jgi:hypothetical protein
MSIFPKRISAPPPLLKPRNIVKAEVKASWGRLARQLPPVASDAVAKYLRTYPAQEDLACEILADSNNRRLFADGCYHCANGDLDQLLDAIDGERLKDSQRQGTMPKAAARNPFETMIALGRYVERLRSAIERGETTTLLAVFQNYQDRKIAAALPLPNGINKNRQAHILERIFTGIGPQAVFSLLATINCLRKTSQKPGNAEKLAVRYIGAIARSRHAQAVFNILQQSLAGKTANHQVLPRNLGGAVELELVQELAKPLFFPMLYYLNQTEDQAPIRAVLEPIIQKTIHAMLRQPETIVMLTVFLEANPETIDSFSRELVEATSREIRASVLSGIGQMQDNLEYLNGPGREIDNKETLALAVRLSAWRKQLNKLRTEDDVAQATTRLGQMLELTPSARISSAVTNELLIGYQLVMTSALPEKGARVAQAALEYQSETLVCGFLMKEVDGNLANANRLRLFLKEKELWSRLIRTMSQRKEEALSLFINNLVFEAKKRAGHIQFSGLRTQLIAVQDPFQPEILEEALNSTLHLLG